jgi:hypothetical protein
LYLERAQYLERYMQVFESLRMVSLSQQKSLDLLARMCHEYKRD